MDAEKLTEAGQLPEPAFVRGQYGKRGGLKGYCERTGYNKVSVMEWARAAEVFEIVRTSLLSAQQLYAISKAPRPAWLFLGERAEREGLTVAALKSVVRIAAALANIA